MGYQYQPPKLVRFKPLEWERSPYYLKCHSAVGIYQIERHERKDGSVFWAWLHGEGDVLLHGKACEAEFGAIQECEDDFRARISEGLEIVAGDGDALAHHSARFLRDPDTFNVLFDAIGLPETPENRGRVDGALVAVAGHFGPAAAREPV